MVPLCRSRKLQCLSRFRLCADKGKPQSIRVTQFHGEHTEHPCTETFIKNVPIRRRLTEAEKEDVETMVDGLGKPMAIRDEIRKRTGKAVTAKDLENLK